MSSHLQKKPSALGGRGFVPPRVRSAAPTCLHDPVAGCSTCEEPGDPSDVQFDVLREGANAGSTEVPDGGRADTGGILVSDVVRQAVAGKDFTFEDRGEVELRGFEEPVPAVLWDS